MSKAKPIPKGHYNKEFADSLKDIAERIIQGDLQGATITSHMLCPDKIADVVRALDKRARFLPSPSKMRITIEWDV